MIETKGFWDVLEAVRILVKERDCEVYCKFSGRFLGSPDGKRFPVPGEAKEAFNFFIEENELKEHVDYVDGLYGEDKAEAFRDSHIFLLPSNYVNEGQPVSVLEAMAYGSVVIATKYRLIPEMVQDGQTGFFVPYNDAKAIADKIELLIANPHEFTRLSCNSRKRFQENFRIEAYYERMIQVFRAVESMAAPVAA